MAYTALQFNTNALYEPVTQVGNGFSVGDIVGYNGTDFILSNNTSKISAQVVGMVSSLVNADQFYLTQEGFVFGLTTIPAEGGAYVPGSLYYLSSTSGLLTAIEPVAVGLVKLPCFKAYTATTGFFFASVGNLIESGALFAWQTIVANQTLAVNNGYFCDGGAQLQLLLPTVSSVGDEIKIISLNAFGFSINQNNAPMQSIQFLGGSTTAGSGGSAATSTAADSVDIVCNISNTHWINSGLTGPTLLIT